MTKYRIHRLTPSDSRVS